MEKILILRSELYPYYELSQYGQKIEVSKKIALFIKKSHKDFLKSQKIIQKILNKKNINI
jgi:hypothetical protein